MLKKIIVLVLACFLSFFLDRAFAGAPPSTKLNLPAKYEGKQKVSFGSSVVLRDITVIIFPDGSGKIITGDYMLPGGRGFFGQEYNCVFQVEGDDLVVIKSDDEQRLRNLRKFQIVGDEVLITPSWKMGSRNDYDFESTNLKRTD